MQELRVLLGVLMLLQSIESLGVEYRCRSQLLAHKSPVFEWAHRPLAWLRLLFSGVLVFGHGGPWLMLGLILSQFFYLLRFSGAFNGGSDSMTTQILVAVFISSAFGDSPGVVRLALLWVAIQSVLSYFLSGVAKLRTKEWRSGEFLMGAIRLSPVSVRGIRERLLACPSLLRSLSFGVLGFELGFPLALVSPKMTPWFLAAGVVFHAANFMVFGLNRFFWAWLASYPAIYFLSSTFLR